ncbi:MAG TPA: DegT/DnrJ/EryC1/StrS family aminotransferase [Conexivisphaerales archaeon]|nr:DegT/DnrJ/EryC1/StrS family aminotransferase [Conexivisphaerales archaeon]
MSYSIPPVKPYFPQEDIDQIKADTETILKSGMLTLGSYTKRFEEEYAMMHGVKYAIAVNSGTSAIEIALRAIKLNPGDEVIVPTNTFTATAAAVFFAGGKPVLADVNPETLTLDLQTVAPKLTSRTRGILMVHIGGLVSPDTPELAKLAKDSKMFLVEDAAHAHGSSYQGVKAGSFGDAGSFSFYPTKVMTTGEGGMITTNDESIANRCRVFRDQGKESFNSNTIIELGYNWRMNEISAAIGITQLRRLEWMIAVRNKLAEIYDVGLAKVTGIKPQKRFEWSVNNYYKYTAMLDRGIDRDSFKLKLREKGVKCGGEVYSPPLHMQPVYQRLLGVKPGDFPVAEDVCSRMVELPMFTSLKEEEAHYVVNMVQQVLA